MGGEWATGAVLVSETFPPEHRNKAISIMQSGWALGYILAAVLAAGVLGNPALGPEAWRWLFVIGVLPALVTLWIRRRVREPEAWTRTRTQSGPRPNAFRVIFGRKLRRRTILVILLGSCVQFAYWGIFFWLPGFLARPVAEGGAGMGVVRSLGWIIPVQIGAYFGYLTFGFIADRIGRRRAFILFMLSAAVLIVIYGQLAASPWWLLALSPVLGYVGHGYFSMFGELHRRAVPHGRPRHRAGTVLQRRPACRRARALRHRRAGGYPAAGTRPRDWIDVGVLSRRRGVGADVAGPERTGAGRPHHD